MDPKDRKRSWTMWYIVIAVMGVLLLQQFWTTMRQTETIAYSEFEHLIATKQISEVVVGPDTIHGTLKSPLASGQTSFATIRVDPAIAEKLEADGIKVTGEAASGGGLIATILSWVLPLVGFYLLWTFLFRGMAEKQGFGGLMSIAKSRAKISVETDTKVNSKDVAGIDEA